MSVASVVAIVAFVTAVLALLVSIRAGRRLLATQAELASANAALDQERQATADSIAAVHRSTVEEVTTLLENVLAQVDTDITAKVAEALALLSPYPESGVGEAEHSLTGTSTHEPTEAQPRNRTGTRSSGPLAPVLETTGQSSDSDPKSGNSAGGLA
jgi:hypothetical protein